MSTINSRYTFQYSQPEEYKFSHDSVFLSYRVFEHLAGEDLIGSRALDLCSGSGIVGMDFLFHRRACAQSTPAHFDFMEVQEVYRSHFMENVSRLGEVATELHFLNYNYNDLCRPEFAQKYDLIVSNPPYFFTWQGKLSPSEFKNRCRFFIDSDFNSLLLGISNALKISGAAYVLLRDLPEHGWNVIEEAKKICSEKLNLQVLGDIRGTHFVKMSRLSSPGGGS